MHDWNIQFYLWYFETDTTIRKALTGRNANWVQACDDMKPILFSEDEGSAVKSSLSVGTQLYELYLALQQFYTLGFSGRGVQTTMIIRLQIAVIVDILNTIL